MYRTFYEGMPYVPLALLAMGLFLAVFLAVVVRAWWLTPPAQHDALAALPLTDDSDEVNP
jgi:hypothetical protein